MPPAKISKIPATTTPATTPPTMLHSSAPTMASGVAADPPANPTRSVKATAAAPSLSRLSASTSRLRRGRTLSSLNAAMTETGSVAAINVPNMAAPIQLQPSSQWVPAATTPAAIATPGKASSAVTGKFMRK